MSNLSVVRSTSLRSQVSEEEWKVRVDLAACYRLMEVYGMTDMIYNHISARVPGHHDQILINPYGFLYEEITASSLMKVDLKGNILLQPDHGFGINPAGYVIHSAVHAARDDVGCVIHTHTRAGMAVSAMKCGLLPLSQTAMRFHGCTAYHHFEGPALNLAEQERLVRDMGTNDVLILHNHGLAACGRTVAEAFCRNYFLENACKAQVDAMAAGSELWLPEMPIRERTAQVMSSGYVQSNSVHSAGPFDASMEWNALLRKLNRIDPSYAQ